MTHPILTLIRSLLIVAVVLPFATAQEPAGLRVVRARCELATDPAGVDIDRPRLSWEVASDQRGDLQTAYQIIAAPSPDLLEQNRGDLWDSGRIESNRTTYVRYDGKPLTSSQDVFWKVRVWDKAGRPSAWGEPARWTMGLLAADDWKGVWIKAATPAESTLMRRELVVRPGLRRAVVHVSGLGQYELMVNGIKAGHDLLTPGWTDYRDTILYDTHDVTAQLAEGRNALALTLADGMHRVKREPGRFAKFVGSFGDQQAILHLRLDYADGSTDVVGTDASWKTHAGPITWSGIYGGEDFDARRVPAGWTTANFDDKNWPAVVEAGKADQRLRGISASADPVRKIETHRPVKAQTFPDGSTVYDFGQNAAFIPQVRVSGPVGSTVRLTPAEVANADGSIWRGTTGGASRGSSWWQYTKSTDGQEAWFPHFFYTGGRYLHAELLPPGGEPSPPSHTGIYPPSTRPSPATNPALLPKIESIEAVVVHSVAIPVGRFETSDPMLNRIRELVRWAQRSNMVSILTDCPHREKLGWLEQTHMNGPAIRYEFDCARIFAKTTHDIADAQDESGLVPNIAPEYTVFKGTFRAAAEWGAAFIAVPWQQYEFDGDIDLLRQHYDAMKRYFAYLGTKVDAEGILSEGLGDWYDLGEGKPGRAKLTPPPVTATAFYFDDARTLAKIATVLGRNDDARAFAAQAEKTRADYNRKFFHADTGTYATGSQCSLALPLAMGIVDPAERPRVLAALVKNVEANGYGMTAGDVGFRYLLKALADANRSDVVLKIVTQDAKPGYARQVRNGETTLTESWDANRTSSHNHFMLGHVTEWFYKDLAGIGADPTGPGFEKIIIRPRPPGGLAWVAATYGSVHGPIAVRWDHADGRFKLDVTVPANTTATVYVPSREGTPITEGGKPVADAAGVRFLRRDGDRTVFAVESGRYVFEAAW